jgi:hypothetical protein
MSKTTFVRARIEPSLKEETENKLDISPISNLLVIL